MKKINFAQVTGLTSPNPLTLICTKKADGYREQEVEIFFRFSVYVVTATVDSRDYNKKAA